MSFSIAWERAYTESRQFSRWPWPTLMALASRYCQFQEKKVRVLELGCGVGANVGFLLSRGADYHGVDGSSTAVQFLAAQYPELKDRFKTADFTRGIPFDGKFDLIFDRAALTHNALSGVAQCMTQVRAKLSPGGIFIGVDWFSSTNDYAKRGEPVPGDPACRTNFKDGPYQGIEPVRFFSKKDITALVAPLQLIHLEEEVTEHTVPGPQTRVAAWSFVAK